MEESLVFCTSESEELLSPFSCLLAYIFCSSENLCKSWKALRSGGIKGLKPGRPGKAGMAGIPREALLGKPGTGNLLPLGDSLFSLGSIGVVGVDMSLSTGP